MYDGPIEICDCFIWDSPNAGEWPDNGEVIVVEKILESVEGRVIFYKVRRMAWPTTLESEESYLRQRIKCKH